MLHLHGAGNVEPVSVMQPQAQDERAGVAIQAVRVQGPPDLVGAVNMHELAFREKVECPALRSTTYLRLGRGKTPGERRQMKI